MAPLDLYMPGTSVASKVISIRDSRPSGLQMVPIRVKTDTVAIDTSGLKVATAVATELFTVRGSGTDAVLVAESEATEHVVYDPERIFTTYPQAALGRTSTSQGRVINIQIRATAASGVTIESIIGSVTISAPELSMIV